MVRRVRGTDQPESPRNIVFTADFTPLYTRYYNPRALKTEPESFLWCSTTKTERGSFWNEKNDHSKIVPEESGKERETFLSNPWYRQ